MISRKMALTMGVAALALAISALAMAGSAKADVNVICSVQAEWCQAVGAGFERASGIKVNLSLKGSGESLAQLRAEKQNPKIDVWFGGTGDPHLIAAEEGLSEAIDSPSVAKLQPWAQQQYATAKKRTVGIYSGAVGFGFNTELLKKKNMAEPKCWADLLKAEYKGEIQVANPNSSGTAYTIIATLVQLWDEEKAFAYLKQLHPNINAYARSGTGPIKAVARGETAVSLSFVHDAVTEANAGFPVSYSTPCEGTGYEIGSMSVVAGSRNLDDAKKFYEWALTPDAQKLGFDVGKQLQMPSNKDAPLPPKAPDLSKMNLVKYDFVKYGASSERKRLLERWDKEVGSLPK